MSNFTLEQAILDCWHVTTDLEHIYENIDMLSKEQQVCVLRGLKELYEIKFNRLWNEFEHSLKTRRPAPIPPPPPPIPDDY